MLMNMGHLSNAYTSDTERTKITYQKFPTRHTRSAHAKLGVKAKYEKELVMRILWKRKSPVTIKISDKVHAV